VATRREPDAPPWPHPPAELRRCSIEDWVTPAERAAHTYARDCPACQPSSPTAPHDCPTTIGLDAFMRHREARRTWLSEQGIPRSRWADVLPLAASQWGGASVVAT
jgi:hypothetical protein